ncbi:MAG: hypothetical protein LKJ80_07330 [Oscillibacter sp.]|nr:hypothetical protein [Oscillibacter sp.]
MTVRAKKYPVKTTMNLAQKEIKHRDMGVVIPTAVVLAVLIGLFCKFGVVDRLNAISRTDSAAVQQEDLLAQLQAQTTDYDQVLEEYQSYTAAKNAIHGGADPMDCLGIIEANLIARSQVQSFAVAPSLITVQLSGVTLNQISSMYQDLKKNPLVSGVQVYTAATQAERNAQVVATMTIQLAAAQAADSADGGEEAASK